MSIYGSPTFRKVILKKDKRINVDIINIDCFICNKRIDPNEICIKRNKCDRFYHQKCFEKKYPNF